jgi:hypothetical protein
MNTTKPKRGSPERRSIFDAHPFYSNMESAGL